MSIRNYLKQLQQLAITIGFSRSRYRFFLKSAITSLDEKCRRLIAATDYYGTDLKPVVISAPFGTSMLVLAPHQDDEAIGCGGAMALQVKAGGRLTTVVLQDGGSEHLAVNMTREALTQLRNKESANAAAVLGLPAPTFLNLQSLSASHTDAVSLLRRLIADQRIDAVFSPHILDDHADHRSTNLILADALRHTSHNVRVFGYEVWGLTVPNVIVPIDNVINLKMEMLRCFPFANQAVDYLNATTGLNMYRSRLLQVGEAKYAECFFEIEKRDFIDMVSCVISRQV